MNGLSDSVNYDLDFSTLNDKKSLDMRYTKINFLQKRVVDYTMTILFILTLWPLVLYTIYRIKKESPGPVFFKQSRVGLNGKTFVCYKFRSMHTDSHFNPYTSDNDSRIFPFGHIMRKMRIDELAQIINVVKGDMHIVGPRAEWDILVKEYEKIIPNYHLRHNIAPGITGLAQVKYPYGRNAYDAKQKLAYDTFYIKNWSILLELKVLLQTVGVILKKSGI